MTTPKELADKAKKQIDACQDAWTPNEHNRAEAELRDTIDQLQAMAEARQATCRDDGRCQYAIDHGAEGMGHCPPGKCAMPPSAQQATGSGQVLPPPFDTVNKVSPEGADYEVPVFSAEQMQAYRAAATQAQPEVPLPVGLTRTDGKLRASVMRREETGDVACVAMVEIDENALSYTLKAVADALAATTQAQPMAECVKCVRCGHDNWIQEGKAPAQVAAPTTGRRKATRFESDPKEHRRVIEGVDNWLAAYNLPTYSQMAGATTTGKREPLTEAQIADAVPQFYAHSAREQDAILKAVRALGITGEQR